MGTVCPICEASPPESATHCPRCGFPTELYPTLHGPITIAPAPAIEELIEGPPPPAAPAVGGGVSPATAVNASIVQGLEERVALLSTLDRDAPDVTGELCEAALNEASGRAADAQQILRSAQGRLDRETEELLGRHITDLEARGKALQETGLRVALEDQLARVAESVLAGEVAAAVPALQAAERRVGLIEAHWRGLQALVAQVMTLRAEAEALGIDIGNACGPLEAARASLATMPATEHDLDVTAQAAAQALMVLHELIPPALEAELQRHQATLEAHHAPARVRAPARKLHAEASEHLREGRLDSAILSLRELRGELARLEREAPPPAPRVEAPAPVATSPVVPTAPSAASAGETPSVSELAAAPAPVASAPIPSPATPPAAGPSAAVPDRAPGAGVAAPAASAPGEPDVLGALMRKARSLAARVRALPPDSTEAADAAKAIQEATLLLKARRFAEADAALTRLMRTLASLPVRS